MVDGVMAMRAMWRGGAVFARLFLTRVLLTPANTVSTGPGGGTRPSLFLGPLSRVWHKPESAITFGRSKAAVNAPHSRRWREDPGRASGREFQHRIPMNRKGQRSGTLKKLVNRKS
jgi:hypothetical protein